MNSEHKTATNYTHDQELRLGDLAKAVSNFHFRLQSRYLVSVCKKNFIFVDKVMNKNHFSLTQIYVGIIGNNSQKNLSENLFDFSEQQFARTLANRTNMKWMQRLSV